MAKFRYCKSLDTVASAATPTTCVGHGAAVKTWHLQAAIETLQKKVRSLEVWTGTEQEVEWTGG